jgi:hypothetical protein
MPTEKSTVYVEVTVPNEAGQPVTFYTDEYTTDELDVLTVHKMLKKSEEAIVQGLGLRQKLMDPKED